MDRRRFVIGTAATALAAGPAFAQEAFPSHAITIINAFPPGGLNDIVTRPLATAMEPILKQPVVVETKAGAAGQIGAQVVASAKPDGYTLLSHNSGISGYAEVDKLFGRPAKVTRAHFIPLARVVADPVLLLVNEAQPYKTLSEFIEGAKAHPDTLVFSPVGSMARATCRWRIWKRRRARCDCVICRPMAAARPSSPCSAITPRSRRNRWGPRCLISKPASCARSPASAQPARRRCPTCRRSKSSASTSNTICGSGYSRRKERRNRP
jgi:Tripartite tricarboxylate transporter family receptor